MFVNAVHWHDAGDQAGQCRSFVALPLHRTSPNQHTNTSQFDIFPTMGNFTLPSVARLVLRHGCRAKELRRSFIASRHLDYTATTADWSEPDYYLDKRPLKSAAIYGDPAVAWVLGR